METLGAHRGRLALRQTRRPLDDEARKRGNSTYLVDRVIPMLPEALSNELCP